MAKKKCACKKRGRRRKPGRPKGSKNKKGRKGRKKGGSVAGLAMGAAKTLGPAIVSAIISDMVLKRLKKGKNGGGLRLL